MDNLKLEMLEEFETPYDICKFCYHPNCIEVLEDEKWVTYTNKNFIDLYGIDLFEIIKNSNERKQITVNDIMDNDYFDELI